MKSLASKMFLIAFGISFALFLSAAIVTAGDDKATSSDARTGASSDKTGVVTREELSFEGVEFETDPLLIYEIYDRVKYWQLRENMSGGVTPKGLNFSVSW